MIKYFSSIKLLWLFVLSFSLLAFTGCSPKVKIGLWYKTHQDAALALGIWVVNSPDEATSLLTMDCTDRKKFKQKITDALNNIQSEQPARQGYNPMQYNYPYGNTNASRKSADGFGDWCRKYPNAAKKLRSHAKALCKTGLGVLNGTYKIN